MNLWLLIWYNKLNKWQFSLIPIHSQSLLDHGDQLVNNLSLLFVNLPGISVSHILVTFHIEVRAELGNPETIKRSRAKNLPKNPSSVGDLILVDEWTNTRDGDKRLIYDNGVDSSNRMPAFWYGWGSATPCEFCYLVPGWDI